MKRRLSVLVVVCVATAGCSVLGPDLKSSDESPGTSRTASVEPSPDQGIVRFPGDGIEIAGPSDVKRLDPAPRSFQDFIASKVSGDDPQCDLPRVIHVRAVDRRGLAVGDFNECGGYIAVWGQDGSGWRELFGTQSPGGRCPDDLAGFSAADIAELADGPLCEAPTLPKPRRETDKETVKSGNFRLGQTAHFDYFDVTVHEHEFASNGVEGGGIYGARVTVCYTRRHPGANADGTTRTSRDPWRFGLVHGMDPVWDRGSKRLSNRWRPVYTERKLAVGQCNSGWLATDIRESVFVAHMGMRYAPADFDFSGSWTWKL